MMSPIGSIRSRAFCVVALFAFASVCTAGVGDEHEHPEMPEDPPGFAKIKALAGHWEGTADHGEQVTAAKVSYKLTAAGSTVIETLFEGTDQEMVTVYRMDGDKLLLTHYCMVMNQPTMAADDAGSEDGLHFVCTGDGHRNMASEDEGHMHEVSFRFIDDNHIQSDWHLFENGEQGHSAKIDLHRVVE